MKNENKGSKILDKIYEANKKANKYIKMIEKPLKTKEKK